MQELLDTDIKFLQGVGPKRAEILDKELNIRTFRDLLYYFPYRYIDRTRFYHIREMNGDLPYIQIRGKITGYEMVGANGGRSVLSPDSPMAPAPWNSSGSRAINGSGNVCCR